MTSEKKPGVPFRPVVRATPDGVRAAPFYINQVRAAHDPNGFTLYFFATPADVAELPEVHSQLEEQADQSNAVVNVALDPLFKAFVPPSALPGLIELLQRQWEAYRRTYAPQLQRFLQGAAEGSPSSETDQKLKK